MSDNGENNDIWGKQWIKIINSTIKSEREGEVERWGARDKEIERGEWTRDIKRVLTFTSLGDYICIARKETIADILCQAKKTSISLSLSFFPSDQFFLWEILSFILRYQFIIIATIKSQKELFLSCK